VQQNYYLVPDVGYFSTVKSPTPLSAVAAEAVQEMRTKPDTAPIIPKTSYGINMEPRIFNQDIQSNAASGEDYDLAMIVRGSFFRKDWGVARSELQNFLQAAQTHPAVTRARFYLGQCRYFLGDVSTALTDFLAVQPIYPVEASNWVQAALAKMGSP
jgi:TolA-binding protein